MKEKMGLETVDMSVLEKVELSSETAVANASNIIRKLDQFLVEYSKSNRSKCKKCDRKIERVKKKFF